VSSATPEVSTPPRAQPDQQRRRGLVSLLLLGVSTRLREQPDNRQEDAMTDSRRTTVAWVVAAAVAVSITTAPSAASAYDGGRPPSAAAMDGHQHSMLHMARQYAAMLAELPPRQLEPAFMAGMIPHHAAAVAMARLELAHGTHPELKAMARDIITAQNTEIEQMTGWLRQWYGLTPEQAPDRAPAMVRQMQDRMDQQMQMMTTMLASAPAGPDFDRAFLQAMIPHHEMAVIEAGKVADRMGHPALATMAGDIVSSQKSEIRQMRTWLREWYRSAA
jgi:uncharacterized protein (DUF305 family)